MKCLKEIRIPKSKVESDILTLVFFVNNVKNLKNTSWLEDNKYNTDVTIAGC